MIYLANPCSPAVREAMSQGLLGCISTPVQGNRIPEGALWCCDNGCFGSGYPGDHELLEWLRIKATRFDMGKCLFAAAPDVVGDALATFPKAMWFSPRFRKLGYPMGYILQDGVEFTPLPLSTFDVAFIGGSTEFKLGGVARKYAAICKQAGKWVHMGRVNSYKRLKYAKSIGCDSVDGTYLKWGPDINLPKLLNWLERLQNESCDVA